MVEGRPPGDIVYDRTKDAAWSAARYIVTTPDPGQDFANRISNRADRFFKSSPYDQWRVIGGVAPDVALMFTGTGEFRFGTRIVTEIEEKVIYIGRIEDLKNIPRSKTLLDKLPDLGSPKANYYQNMSVLRKALRDGYTIKDASHFRLNSELAPTLLRPDRTVRQTFLGAERNLLSNRGIWWGIGR
jgi:hypothetical protein